VLDAWERLEFNVASKALRNLFLWDPDRLRVFKADQALSKTPDWLIDLKNGPQDENQLDFITRVELIGRDLRNQVGAATWISALLEALKKLRKGERSTEVLLQYPGLHTKMPWLIDFEKDRPTLVSPTSPTSLARIETPLKKSILTRGVQETELGINKDIVLLNAIDGWAPEARGSSARVYNARINQMESDIAIKLMRHDRIEYALPLFEQEILILNVMNDVPGITPMIECGFIQFLDDQALPHETDLRSAKELTGRVLRYGNDTVQNFVSELHSRTEFGWLPYIATEKRQRENNLLLLCDSSYTHGRFLPVLDGVVIAIQLCEILKTAHERGIVYRDHKILHYYWQPEYNSAFVIDWNIALLLKENLKESDLQFDLVQFGARTLHHIFTGRPAPGALPLGPNRPEDIESASDSYTTQWTYDDERLPDSIKDILQKLLSGSYLDAGLLKFELQKIHEKLDALFKA
jgi:hypothetical protein